jgi:hypothetical protein
MTLASRVRGAGAPQVLSALVLCMPAVGAAADAAAPAQTVWTFKALLDGKPIGQHQFTLSAASTPDAGERSLVSEASYAVRFLGITVYRYTHRAVERWRGDCLAALSADTDDRGERTSVRAAQRGGAFEVTAPAAHSTTGCVMSIAYWNPALRSQQRLINAQTGRIEAVTVASIGVSVVDVDGRATPAQGWRISGLPQPIDVWYSAQGEWIALDTTVEGGRKLSYRLP